MKASQANQSKDVGRNVFSEREELSAVSDQLSVSLPSQNPVPRLVIRTGRSCQRRCMQHRRVKFHDARPALFANVNLLCATVDFVSLSAANLCTGAHMHYDSMRHHRHSIRLQGYDYSRPGMYYVTLTIQDREQILGSIVGDTMKLSSFGVIVRDEWLRTPTVRPEVMLGEYVIMPDHMHGIIVICDDRNGVSYVGANGDSPRRITPFRSPSRTVGAIIRGFKGASTKRINELRHAPGERVWQRNYYEHIIRDGNDYARIQKYIAENVANWSDDNENSEAFCQR